VSTRALVVLGSSLAGTRRRLVAAAERAAREVRPGLVVFSGAPNGTGRSEAAQMREVWQGPREVDVVLEETASTTAENAVRTLPILLDRRVTEAVVICSPLHLPRARWMFLKVYGEHGVAVSFRLARDLPTPGGLLWELGALAVAARQVRSARAKRRHA
jgi:uncharacterized SAM-binding protein YcdF (DUF218 family)